MASMGASGDGGSSGQNPTAFLSTRDTAVRLPKATRVKNKAPADVQITAEQILRDARSQQEVEIKPASVKFSDSQELAQYRIEKRKHFEDLIRRVKWQAGVWVKYANWEESQKDFERARSVWERALSVDYRNVSVWLKYAEMEMRNKFVNHARNVWDRAVQLLPRVDQLWYKYIHMEEMLGNLDGTRQIFERWMKWEPDHNGWTTYIKFELRYKQTDKAREVYERYVTCLPTIKAWLKYAKFEAKHGERQKAREIYERAVEIFSDESASAAGIGSVKELYVNFAKFEEFCQELERARAIYKFALDNLPKAQAEDLYQDFMTFEKKYGNKEGIEDVVISKKRLQYENDVRVNPHNYDTWFDYIRLEESSDDIERTREVYERAIANVPPAKEKRFWQRYIYLWVNYALFEELIAKDAERTRQVYKACLELIPHNLFTFAKIWILAAQFEIRQKNLSQARKFFGRAIGVAAKEKIFKSYIELELQLGNMDRCRKLYEKYLDWDPANCQTWCRFAELEASLGEVERSKAIFELAITQPVLDRPELLWKQYIDFEIGEGEIESARELYERLLERTKHVKVWLSYATFEVTNATGNTDIEDESKTEDMDPEGLSIARGVYRRADEYFKGRGKDERVLILDAWLAFERKYGSRFQIEHVESKMPRRVKRRRENEDGTMEEYYDYLFEDEEGNTAKLKLLQAAYMWKKRKVETDQEDGVKNEDEDAQEVPVADPNEIEI